jgi:hypothetical protein
MHAVKVSGWLLYGTQAIGLPQWSCVLRSARGEGARAVDGFPNVFPIVRVVLLRTPVETLASGRNGSPLATKRQRDELRRILLLADQTCVTSRRF